MQQLCIYSSTSIYYFIRFFSVSSLVLFVLEKLDKTSDEKCVKFSFAAK